MNCKCNKKEFFELWQKQQNEYYSTHKQGSRLLKIATLSQNSSNLLWERISWKDLRLDIIKYLNGECYDLWYIYNGKNLLKKLHTAERDENQVIYYQNGDPLILWLDFLYEITLCNSKNVCMASFSQFNTRGDGRSNPLIL